MSEFIKLSDLAILITKGSTPTTYGYSFKDEGIPFIKAEALNGEVSLDIKGFSYVDEETHNFLKRSKIYPNDILMTIAGANIGKVGFVRDNIIEANTNQAVAIIRLDQEKVCSQFYYYYFKQNSFFRFVQSLNAQAAQPNINLKMIGDFPVPRLDLNTQRKVVELLGNIDDLYICNQDRISKLDKIISNIYTDWFINFKFPNHEQVNFVDGIPEGWVSTTINDVCTTVSGGTPSTKVEAYWENGSIEWVTPTDITKLKSLILLNPEKKISQLGLEKSSAKLLPPNTILMTSRASIGYFGLIDKEVCTNQGFISIIPDREILRYYLLFNLKSRISEIDALASGATFKEISKSTFRSMPILIPSDKVLEAFDNVVRPIISQMRNLELQNDNLLKLKETLLPRLMSGELDVSKLSSIE
ncbi:TPA: restriction endonuclease subunit S [Acinetobacter baumannii]|jgi:type I restriction enzyme S subunit|uniref:Type I restriction modification DNA specificity domain protein n=2 Tax=Acinetobacter baumannii TaxID=470 RepID=A0A009IKZ4_ACIB9|nr:MULTISPECIES: restriction endonuclease subunit S [Acinetobacter]ELB0344435.1 restriction endonuclease subunit S [Acinetobacter baumannii]EXB04468.1 type I restriction modification DNA specificity domain protein [Acinetobacter baumannii 1295743]MBK4748140.1 hypothetical protein [Acinetobacter baumannii]MCY0273887.1 restriction endonuclease subunit S [Acinetobacter baumannii]RSO15056.1 restriction endonuclease subunit S [Acinetobacter pittii]